MNRIYADNAATTRMSGTAVRAMTEALEHAWGNPSSLHTTGQEAKRVLEDARETFAKYLHANPGEIYFTSGGSESDNQALRTAVANGRKKGRNHVVTTAFEHHAILHTLEALHKEWGTEYTLVPIPENGIIRVEDVAAAIRDDTALVTVMTANNEIGTIQPIHEIGELCLQRKVVFHTDAVQAGGILDLDVERDHIDMLSLSAHKFHGPKGVGVLYVRRGNPVYTLINGGAQERGKRAGTENVPSIAGAAAAFREACENRAAATAQLTEMRDYLLTELAKIPHSIVNGDPVTRLPGNVHLCFEGIEGEGLLLLLDANGIAASSGSACTSGSLDPSHVLLALGRPHEIAHGSLRLSLSTENTMDDARAIAEIVPQVVEYLRGFSPVWHDLLVGKTAHII